MPRSPVEMLEFLKASTFTIDQVAEALLIRPMLIMNYQQKNSLDLCSVAPGRGSPRRFCVLDVYMIALLREILPITGNASLAARDVNRLVYSDDPLNDPPPPPSRRAVRKREYRDDLELAHELFSERRMLGLSTFGHKNGDWFLLASDIEQGFLPFRFIERGAQYRANEFGDLLYHGAIARRSGAFINATKAISYVDERLFGIVNGGIQ